MGNRLTIVSPCYNEEDVLAEAAKLLGEILDKLIAQGKIAADSKILFVNDGSVDATWQMIKELEHKSPKYTGIKFSRNFGHQNALMAGLKKALPWSDMVITIDVDLQDDVEKIYEMVDCYHAGNDIVYAVRNNRDTDSKFKRNTALFFYWMMKKMGVELVPNHADYRLMSQRAVKALLEYREENLFIRGIIPKLGFKNTKVYYARKERYAGVSHYPLKKMLNFAINGITSFTIVPIKIMLYLGIVISTLSGLCLLWVLYSFLTSHTVSGWASVMMSLWFLGGFQLITISIVGTYIGKIFVETKHRPRYIIEEDDYTQGMTNQLAQSQVAHGTLRDAGKLPKELNHVNVN
ncbi:glycosyltransferase family 2 protein [Liquorilactobacillus satsumensis]|uniref:Glycosyltransferase n=1 Tax=Liquorilactobacillus satsumensis DSM 16230 = JCM 12392 TaxID=1423801 RepID=A0A0R1UZT4_9LACO|nr:glycosyltransferase family 2 protein [Liquorilactobacillus satsumensis]KRL98848.1 glycosyltransferase [Liquorilactobacillus satsumensis DSM 16230 = JCM 12392]MCC7666309.1 glycosyltransferase [Liquorilactobacillus satsumensis]MCP9312764.1 glycosyltransferase family 2 protein [Liquorilactobacillus satsumensis]MCP9358414.1 glycosyltransferase family 2 protein [Liquorilactobacillus satsumensis]MCP9359222.1 glycosyltransferase family 2 protein [Liquorilactobacillus satsumensis]